jgi:hypothetical protein
VAVAGGGPARAKGIGPVARVAAVAIAISGLTIVMVEATAVGRAAAGPATGTLQSRVTVRPSTRATVWGHVLSTAWTAMRLGIAHAPNTTVAPPSTTTSTTPPSGLAELAAAVADVVPAWARVVVQPTYSIGEGGCGDGCTWPGDPPLTRFSSWVMAQSFPFVEAAVAHEYAHALGFTHLTAYRFSDWSDAPEPWAREFHALDSTFRGADDREAFAACIARAWTGGYDWTPEQIRATCPLQLATWVDQQAAAEVGSPPAS